MVVSDHGFDPFHTAVSIGNLLASSSVPTAKVRAVTSGPAVNFYISLAGREPNGTVGAAEFVTLQRQLVGLVNGARDTNVIYAGKRSKPLFDKVYARPVPVDPNDPAFGRATTKTLGQDFGDVFAMLTTGYNFDGAQSPVGSGSGIRRQPCRYSRSPTSTAHTATIRISDRWARSSSRQDPTSSAAASRSCATSTSPRPSLTSSA